MPDTAISPDLPKAQDVLASARHKVEVPTFTDEDAAKQAEITTAAEKTNLINEARINNPDDLSATLGEVSTPPEYTVGDIKETATSLGKNIDADGDITNELKPIAQYLEAARKAQLNGTDLTAELGANADDIQKKVAEIIISRGRLLEKFPDMAEAFEGPANNDNLKDYVEQLIARDPRSQREIAKELKRIHEEAKKIEDSSESEEKTKLTRQQEALTTLQESLIGRIKSTLDGRGLDSTKQAQIEELIKVGNDPQTIIEMIKIELNLDSSFDEYRGFDESYTLHKTEEESYETNLTNERLNVDGRGFPKRPQEIARLQQLVIQARSRKNNATASMNSIKSAYQTRNSGTDDAQFLVKYQEHMATTSLLNENGPLSKTLETATQNQDKLKDLDAQIKKIESNPNIKEAQKNKDKLIKELEASIDTAMSKFLVEKYKDFVSDQDIFIQTSISKAEKDGKTWKADGIKKVKANMDKWSKFENGKFDRDKNEISISVKAIAEHSAAGEDGARQMVAEATGFKLNPDELKAQVAVEIRAGATYDSLSDAEKIQADATINQRTDDFESIMEEHGDNYKKRLFAEFQAARGFADKLGRGKLSLTEDEVNILNSQFGPMMESELEKSRIFKALIEKGLIPNTKTKWLIFMAIILGLGIAAIGIAPAAVAAGGAAKEIITNA